MAPSPVLEVLEEVEFRYPQNPLHKYSIPAGLCLHRGEAWCIHGVSGSGKTTLMTLLASLRRLQKGRIRYRFTGGDTVDVHPANWRWVAGPDLWRRIGFAFQRPELLRSLTVAGNLELVSERKAAALFEAEEWAKIAASRVWKVSGGQIQRLGLLRAFGPHQGLTFLDEPTNNLDMRNRQQVIDFVHQGQRDRGLIVVSHDDRFLAGLKADRLLAVREQPGSDGEVLRALCDPPPAVGHGNQSISDDVPHSLPALPPRPASFSTGELL